MIWRRKNTDTVGSEEWPKAAMASRRSTRSTEPDSDQRFCSDGLEDESQMQTQTEDGERTVLEQVTARYDALTQLRQDFEDTQDLLQNMHILVQQQGCELDTIEVHVSSTEANGGKAATELCSAGTKGKKKRKKAWKTPFGILAICGTAGCAAAGPLGWIVGIKAMIVIFVVAGTGVATGAAGRTIVDHCE
jgi:hypothetical protein